MRVKGEGLRSLWFEGPFQSRLCIGFRVGLEAVLGARLKGE